MAYDARFRVGDRVEWNWIPAQQTPSWVAGVVVSVGEPHRTDGRYWITVREDGQVNTRSIEASLCRRERARATTGRGR